MALLDRDYMRPDYKGRPPQKPSASAWQRVRFLIWRIAQALRQRVRKVRKGLTKR